MERKPRWPQSGEVRALCGVRLVRQAGYMQHVKSRENIFGRFMIIPREIENQPLRGFKPEYK